MGYEWLYMNKVNSWEKMDVALSANAEQVPKIEINLPELREKSQRARALFAQQAVLMAAKQEITRELQQVIQDGDALMKFLREGLKAHYGKDSDKLTEFGIQPFRGLTRRSVEKPEPPLPETVAPSTPSAEAPDTAK
ncbi:MAG TPA: hypothetical protein VN493_01465 [Thermoanaerobaculia bacterium]|nr:hypothetical protein [Thermoanaerobaculia bacterium]